MELRLEILGKVENKKFKPWRTGTSHVLTVPFSESIEKEFEALDAIGEDGRRYILYCEIQDVEVEMGDD